MHSFCPKCCRRCKRIWGEILMVIETAALIPKVCIDLVGNTSGYESVKAENTAWSGRWNQKMNFVLRLARSSYFVLVTWTLCDFGSESGESSLNIGSFAIMEIFEKRGTLRAQPPLPLLQDGDSEQSRRLRKREMDQSTFRCECRDGFFDAWHWPRWAHWHNLGMLHSRKS